MATKAREELSVVLDWDIIDACNGFTFDIGGSVMKLAYISPDDWVDPKQRKKGSKGTVRLINFSRGEITEAFEFIRTKVHLSRASPDQLIEVYSTGVGGTQFAKDFKAKLNVKTNNLTEMDCFIYAFKYMVENVSRKDLLESAHKLAFEQGHKAAASMLAMSEKMQSLTQGFGGPTAATTIEYPQEKENWKADEPLKEDQLFPCILVMCGSGIGIMTVNEDGTFMFVDGTSRGGRMFLGLGSLLAKAKSYEELISLCEKGRSDQVTTTAKHLGEGMSGSGSDKDKGEEDLYEMWLTDEDTSDDMVYSFGEAVGKDIGDFQREDLARSLLDTLIQDLIQCVHITAKGREIKHVFFCGGFVTFPLTRELIYTEWVKRDTVYHLMEPNKQGLIQIHFLTHGQSLGAMGALMNHKLKWSEKTAATDNTRL